MSILKKSLNDPDPKNPELREKIFAPERTKGMVLVLRFPAEASMEGLTELAEQLKDSGRRYLISPPRVPPDSWVIVPPKLWKKLGEE